MSDREFLTTLEAIDAELSVAKAADMRGMDGSQLCETYKKIRGPLESLIPMIKMIPVWGEKLATALVFLMTLADTVCPA